MATVVKKSVAPIYLVAALWLGWSVIFPLYRWWHYAAVIVISVVAFVLGKAVWPDKAFTPVQTQPAPEAAPQAPTKPTTSTTDNPQLDALIAEQHRAVSEMRRLNDNIKDEGISAQIDHMEEVTNKIVGLVTASPGKLPQIQRFLNYYLPTTLKLLNAYDRMDSAGISGSNIDGTMGKIETMMTTIVTAFDRQLDALFGDEALDISTDITVMEQMLAREGIGGMQMETEQ